MHVSVEREALTRAGYASLSEGLDDTGLRRIDMDMGPSCEAPRLDAGGSVRVSIASEVAARSYRQHLYEHAVSLSAVRITRPTAGLPAEEWGSGIEAAMYSAETVGAPVLCVEAEACAKVLAERESGLRIVIAVAPRSCTRETLEALIEPREDEASGLGLAVDMGELFAAAACVDGAYDLLRWIAPYVRHLVCGAGREGAGPARLAEGNVDYARVAAILGNAGYAGALTATLPRGDPDPSLRDILRADVAYLRDIVGEYP